MPPVPCPTIVIIDDNDDVRDSLCALLEAHGFEVLDFPSGAAFFSHPGGVKGDCFVLDVNMPNMTGVDVLKTLRAAGDLTPAVLTTWRRDPKMQMNALGLGVPLLEKPLRMGAMVAAIRRVTSA